MTTTRTSMNLIQFLALARAGTPLALPEPVRALVGAVARTGFDWDGALARIPSQREARRCYDYFARLEEAAPRIVGEGGDLPGEIALVMEAITDRIRSLESRDKAD